MTDHKRGCPLAGVEEEFSSCACFPPPVTDEPSLSPEEEAELVDRINGSPYLRPVTDEGYVEAVARAIRQTYQPFYISWEQALNFARAALSVPRPDHLVRNEVLEEALDAFPEQTRAMLKRGMPIRALDRTKEYLPWRLFDHQQAYTNHQQTLFRLGERGGLSWCEAAAIIEKRKWHSMDEADAKAACYRALKAVEPK